MSTLAENLRIAQAAINYTTGRLYHGRGNSWSDNFNTSVMIGYPALCVIRLRNGINEHITLTQLAQQAENAHCGNCGEHAAVTMMYLHRQGIRPLDYMNLTNGDHAFVIIDRANNTNIGQITTWGATAVVCDSWSRTAYPVSQININMRSMCDGQNPLVRSVVRVQS